jgi:hypothetical protein
MEHQQSGPSNIMFQIEKCCYNFTKKIFCIVYPDPNDDYFEDLEDIDIDIYLESQNIINDYKPLIKRNNNINIEQIIIEEYFEI